MSLFVIDTERNLDLLKDSASKKDKKQKPAIKPLIPDNVDPGSEEEDDGDYGGLPPPSVDISHIVEKLTETKQPKTKLELNVEYAINAVKAAEEAPKQSKKRMKFSRRPNKDLIFEELDKTTGKVNDTLSKTNVAEELKTSTMNGIEKVQGLPQNSFRKMRKLRKIEASKTKGEGWFNMKATEVTEEVENDLKILQMRSVLNPKQFYKKNDLKVLPKYFQIGTVQHSPLDYYNERDTRKNKKKSLVEDLLADAEFQKYNKRKYQEVVAKNDMYARRKAMKKMKKLKKNKK